MHEMSLVRSIVRIVVDEADAAQAAKVKKVHLVIGEGRDIILDLFQSLFQFLARGTVAEGAEIEIKQVPYMVRCNQCGCEYHIIRMDRRTYTCPQCQAEGDYKIVSGMEFYISRIEASRDASITETAEDK